ncbi:SGNH/GDSL hydrolase family protein [Mesorhizobium sp. M0678]|uniref:SGNH/GDSL hydrolase family protein n=1 Tax=Mesorhizobium sp. M0678 TaxID=2956985 RepID=UPI00333C3DCA
MAETGIYSTDLPLVAALDEVTGNATIDGIRRSARQSMADHAEQIAADGPIADALAAEATARAAADVALNIRVDAVASLPEEVEDLTGRVDAVEDIATAGVIWTTQIVKVRSTANVNLASGLINAAVLNGVALVTGDHVFLGSQTLPAENGLYTVVAAGAASRAIFADSAAELAHIGFVVQSGTVGTGERWTLAMAAAGITLGTTALNFSPEGIEPGYAAEVQTARGPYVALNDRLDALQLATLNDLSQTLQYDDSGVAIALDTPIPSILIKDAAAPAKRFFGSLTAKLSTTRTTAGWYFDKLGLLKQAGVNIPRFTYDYKSLAPRGLLIEPARANRVLWNRDLTNAAWTKSNITAALDQVGLDGIAASASSITATAANGTALQAIAIASAAYFQTAYIKRLVGTGPISMTMDGGTTWTDVTPADANWNRMSIPSQTLPNPNVGFRIGTSGDSFAIDLVQNENGNYRSSPMVTTTAFFSRGADIAFLALSGIPFNVALGSLFVEGRTQAPDNVSRTMVQIDDGTNNNKIVMAMSSLGGGQLALTTAGATAANILPGITVVDKTTRMAGSWGANYAQAALDGSVGAQDSVVTVPAGLATLRIGGGLSGTSPFGGTIARITLRLRTQDASELTALSNFGIAGAEPLVDVVPNNSNIEDSDYAATLTATSSQVSGVRPISFGGYQNANPGWRRRFKTRATSVVLHFQNLNLVTGSYNGKGEVLVDGVHNTYFTSAQALGKFFVRLDFASNADRLIEIVMPYSASIAHLGITTYGAPVTLPTPRSTLPRAVFLGDSRLQGFNATSTDKTWMEILCRAKGWQHINLGYGSSLVNSAWGTDLGNANPDVAFVTFDFNNRTAQTSLATFKAALKTLIANVRAIKPTVKIYVVSSNWISAANDALTLKIADYRQQELDAVSELTAAGDANIFYIDGLTLTTNGTGSVTDGIHPNDTGSAEWAAAVAPLVTV